MIVENQLTPLTRAAAANALVAAYQQLTGQEPSLAVTALLLAHSALETGNWQKIHNFNFGNIKAGPHYPRIVQFRCSEVDAHGVEHFFDPPDPHCNFRAYEEATAGALDYLKVLRSRPHWWQGLHSENPSTFVDALATPPRYFTGNRDKYKRAVTALFGSFGPLAATALGRPPAPRPPVAVPVEVPPSSSASPPLASSGEVSGSNDTGRGP